jgi:hypothetical protein
MLLPPAELVARKCPDQITGQGIALLIRCRLRALGPLLLPIGRRLPIIITDEPGRLYHVDSGDAEDRGDIPTGDGGGDDGIVAVDVAPQACFVYRVAALDGELVEFADEETSPVDG